MVIGGVFGFFLPYSVAYLFYKFRGIEGGGGDIKQPVHWDYTLG